MRWEGLPLVSVVRPVVALVIAAWGRGIAVLPAPGRSNGGRDITVLATALVPVHMVPVMETEGGEMTFETNMNIWVLQTALYKQS